MAMTENFDQHAAMLLHVAGYECTKCPASWEDVGGPESGPRIVGGPAFDEWMHSNGHCFIVVEGVVVEEFFVLPTPPGWE